MKLTRKSLERRILLAELALIEASVLWVSYSHHSPQIFFALSVPGAILGSCIVWIRWLLRHDVTNFDVSIVLGFFVLAALLWRNGDKAVGAATTIVAMIAAIWLLRKLLKPQSREQQDSNLKWHQARAAADSHPLLGDLFSVLFLAGMSWYFWAETGYVRTRSGLIFLAVPMWVGARTVFLYVAARRENRDDGFASIETTE